MDTSTMFENMFLSMDDEMFRLRASDIADIRNIAPSQGPGASLGAHVIGFFVDEATPWAHLDIAGVNQADKASPLVPKGMSGFGVRLLDQLARTGE